MTIDELGISSLSCLLKVWPRASKLSYLYLPHSRFYISRVLLYFRKSGQGALCRFADLVLVAVVLVAISRTPSDTQACDFQVSTSACGSRVKTSARQIESLKKSTRSNDRPVLGRRTLSVRSGCVGVPKLRCWLGDMLIGSSEGGWTSRKLSKLSCDVEQEMTRPSGPFLTRKSFLVMSAATFGIITNWTFSWLKNLVSKLCYSDRL